MIVFLFSAFYFVFSDIVLAAEIDNPTINLNCETNPSAYPWCEAAKSGNLGGLVNNFYKIALGLAGASALGVLIYGSILWTLSGAVTSKQDAMGWISGALWGLALLLGAYLILNTINPQLTILKEPDITAVSVPAPEKPYFAGGSDQNTPSETQAGRLSAAETRKQFSPQTNWIGVKDECPPGQSIGCVKTDGLKQQTVSEINELRTELGKKYTTLLGIDNAGGTVYVTGGTEEGPHTIGTYSHGAGYKVDLRLNQQLDSYIQQNYKQIGNRSDGAPQYISPRGAIYAKEGDHWDVLVK